MASRRSTAPTVGCQSVVFTCQKAQAGRARSSSTQRGSRQCEQPHPTPLPRPHRARTIRAARDRQRTPDAERLSVRVLHARGVMLRRSRASTRSSWNRSAAACRCRALIWANRSSRSHRFFNDRTCASDRARGSRGGSANAEMPLAWVSAREHAGRLGGDPRREPRQRGEMVVHRPPPARLRARVARPPRRVTFRWRCDRDRTSRRRTPGTAAGAGRSWSPPPPSAPDHGQSLVAVGPRPEAQAPPRTR